MRARAVRPDSAEKTVRDIRRATRRQYSAEEKIRIVLEGLRGESGASSLQGLAAPLRGRSWCERRVKADVRGNIDEMRRLAREAVATQPDIIFANSTPVTTALHREAHNIPIVFAIVSDPGAIAIVDRYIASIKPSELP
jgi:transposase